MMEKPFLRFTVVSQLDQNLIIIGYTSVDILQLARQVSDLLLLVIFILYILIFTMTVIYKLQRSLYVLLFIQNIEDSLSTHNNMMFSTKTRNNYIDSNNCAANYDACWWFAKCHKSLLTGIYGQNLSFARGITWNSDWGFYKFAKFATMMIRPN